MQRLLAGSLFALCLLVLPSFVNAQAGNSACSQIEAIKAAAQYFESIGNEQQARQFRDMAKSCETPTNASCTLGSKKILHAQSIKVFKTASVPYGTACQSEMRKCNNGVLSGSWVNETCTVATAKSCVLNGVTVAHGSSRVFYSQPIVSSGSTCTSVGQSRTCTNGTLSGAATHSYASCTVSASTSCTFNGATIANAGSVTAYQSSSVPLGSSCVSETRTCNSGVLSGSYQFGSCTVSSSPVIAKPTCTLTGPAKVPTKSPLALSWQTTNNPTSVKISLGATVLGSSLPAIGSYTVTSPGFPAKYNYTMTVENSAGSNICTYRATVHQPGATAPLAFVWPQLYGQFGSYGQMGTDHSTVAAALRTMYGAGFKLNFIRHGSYYGSQEIRNDLETYDAARIDNQLLAIIYEACGGWDGDKKCPMSTQKEQEVLTQIKEHLARIKDDTRIVAFFVLDDYPGYIRPFLEKVRALVLESNKTSAVARPIVCSFGGNLNEILTKTSFNNFSPAACDAVNLYYYGVKGNKPNARNWEMTKLLPSAKEGLKQNGWDAAKHPLLASTHAFGALGNYVQPSREDMLTQAKAFCEGGAVGNIFFTWDLANATGPADTPYMFEGLKDGYSACKTIWSKKTTEAESSSFVAGAANAFADLFRPWRVLFSADSI